VGTLDLSEKTSLEAREKMREKLALVSHFLLEKIDSKTATFKGVYYAHIPAKAEKPFFYSPANDFGEEFVEILKV
jgi:hypothetical protein